MAKFVKFKAVYKIKAKFSVPIENYPRSNPTPEYCRKVEEDILQDMKYEYFGTPQDVEEYKIVDLRIVEEG